MKASDIGSSGALICLGAFALWQSEKISIGHLRMPGPGFFPFYLGLMLIAAALIILIQGVKQKTSAGHTEKRSYARVVSALAGIFAYSLTFEFLGYLLSTFFLMILLINMMIQKKWWFAPSISGVISLSTYILFKFYLEVHLPRGILYF